MDIPGQTKQKNGKFVNEYARFENPGDLKGWTGQGGIEADPSSGENAWCSTNAKRDYGEGFEPFAEMEVSIRVKAMTAGTELIATHSAGEHRIVDLPLNRYSLFQVIGARTGQDGSFAVEFRSPSGASVMIHSTQVMGPVKA